MTKELNFSEMENLQGGRSEADTSECTFQWSWIGDDGVLYVRRGGSFDTLAAWAMTLTDGIPVSLDYGYVGC